MDYVRNAGLEVEIVPGISSSIGVPGSIGIPVTHRGMSESFWVVVRPTKMEILLMISERLQKLTLQ